MMESEIVGKPRGRSTMHTGENKNVIVNHLHFKRLVVLVGYILNNNDNKKGIKTKKKRGGIDCK